MPCCLLPEKHKFINRDYLVTKVSTSKQSRHVKYLLNSLLELCYSSDFGVHWNQCYNRIMLELESYT